mgnify:CR=1 FL=1
MDPEEAGKLEDESRYQSVSKEELLEHIQEGDKVADIGSGTGFFTDDISEIAGEVYAVDFQEQMHDYYREKGLPRNVSTLTSKASDIELEDLDVVISIFSLHEIDLDKALQRFSKLLNQNGKLVAFDWSANGSGDKNPPLEKRLDADSATRKISNYFEKVDGTERNNTFKVVAEKPVP